MADATAVAPTAAPEEVYVAETELKAGALGLWGGMIQAVTQVTSHNVV
jgi:hypothetical protein